MSVEVNMIGKRFGHLVVIEKSNRKNHAQQTFWICRCDCGNIIVVRGDNLRRNGSHQCSDCNGHRGQSSEFIHREVEDT